uniref:Uncharacterized protein n=1 Tax=Mucochytrium quahogii TaxID=96639 RepID=A0A7S2WKF0_9STRA|mmetsp:Transcript_25798/g.56048  ORF Transcript_25798/g.56048 Transcript_25798/m.56048 type:complete len:830 (+) Transcript_25798:285-2774(+)
MQLLHLLCIVALFTGGIGIELEDEPFIPLISETCAADDGCKKTYEAASEVGPLLEDWDEAMQLPLGFGEQVEDMKTISKVADNSMGTVTTALSTIQRAPYVGVIAKVMKTTLDLLKGQVSTLNTVTSNLDYSVVKPTHAVHGSVMEIAEQADDELIDLSDLFESALNFIGSMEDLCAMPILRADLNDLLAPLEECAETVALVYRQIEGALGNVTTFIKRSYESLQNATYLETIKNQLASAHASLVGFWNVIGPVVEAISDALNFKLINIDWEFCVNLWIFGRKCVRIKIHISILDILNFVGGALNAIFNVLKLIPGLGHVIRLIDDAITAACEAILQPLLDKLGLSIEPLNINVDFLRQTILGPLATVVNDVRNVVYTIGNYTSPLKEKLGEAVTYVKDTVTEHLGIDPICMDEDIDPLECVGKLFPSLDFNMQMPVDLDGIVGGLKDVDIFARLSNGIKGCKQTSLKPICEFVAISEGCLSELKIPVCEELDVASPDTPEGKALFDALSAVGEGGDVGRRLTGRELAGLSFDIYLSPNIKKKEETDEKWSIDTVKMKIINFLEKKKKQLPTNQYIDFGLTEEIQVFEWQVRFVLSFSNRSFVGFAVQPRIKYMQIKYKHVFETISDWPANPTMGTMADADIPGPLRNLGASAEEQRLNIVRWLRRRVNKGNHFSMSALEKPGNLMGLDFTKWESTIEFSFLIAKATVGTKAKNHWAFPDKNGLHMIWNNGLFEAGFIIRYQDNAFEVPLAFSVTLPSLDKLQDWWTADKKTLSSTWTFLTRKADAKRKHLFSAFLFSEWQWRTYDVGEPTTPSPTPQPVGPNVTDLGL